MKVLVLGATGFIGRALSLRLLRDRHTVVAYTRSEKKARAALGADVEIAPAASGIAAALSGVDAVVNLAGESVLAGRWTDAQRRRIVDSRVRLTDELVHQISISAARPRILVSASAVGFYGQRVDDAVTEDAPAANDFLARVCVDWEGAALRARALGLRVVLPRIGLVLGREGGALNEIMLAHRFGVGARLGSGRQWMSWIHLDDMLEILVAALVENDWDGPINAVAPHPVPNSEFAAILDGLAGRSWLSAVPKAAVKLKFGDGASAVLGGQRVAAAKLAALGFRFSYPKLQAALEQLVLPDRTLQFGRAGSLPESPYLDKRRARYQLAQETMIAAPKAAVFDFFSRAENLGSLTPPALSFAIVEKPDALFEGAKLTYRVQLGPAPIDWETRIDQWVPGEYFVDSQTRGPYRSWWHKHTFQAEGDRTRMLDTVLYSPPFGVLGRMANSAFVEATLRRIFEFRADAARWRFGP